MDDTIVSWAALPDDVLRACLRPFGVRQHLIGLLNAGAACSAWRQVADSNHFWADACAERWPETAGLRGVSSYKALYRRMGKADRRIALREPPSALQFMVRWRMEGIVVLAHTFTWSEAEEDGTWTCPPLAIPQSMLERAASDYAARDLTCFKDFCDWFSSDVTVTVYRELDGRIARMLPQTSPELPSEFCDEAEYEDKVTFTGFEERFAHASLVLGAQFSCTEPLPDELLSGGELQACDASMLEAYRCGLKLRLGYWPTTSFNDPQRATIDWQGTFEASSSDKVGFATFVHCLLDGAAEFSWLHVSPDAPPPPATSRQMTPSSARAR